MFIEMMNEEFTQRDEDGEPIDPEDDPHVVQSDSLDSLEGLVAHQI